MDGLPEKVHVVTSSLRASNYSLMIAFFLLPNYTSRVLLY